MRARHVLHPDPGVPTPDPAPCTWHAGRSRSIRGLALCPARAAHGPATGPRLAAATAESAAGREVEGALRAGCRVDPKP